MRSNRFNYLTLSSGVSFRRASLFPERMILVNNKKFSRAGRAGRKVAWNSRIATVIVKLPLSTPTEPMGIRFAGEYYRRINFLTLIFPARAV